MSQFVNRCSISLGCFALIFLSSGFVVAQDGSQRESQAQASSDVYPYPTANNPSVGVGSQSAFALSSQSAAGGGRLSNSLSSGSGTTATGNLSGIPNVAANAAASGSGSRLASNVNSNSRAPVEQQVSSTLNPVAQARINQAAVDRLRSQQTASNSNLTASRPPANRTASQANLFGASGSQSTTGFRQPAIQSAAGSTSRNTAPVARCAQACCCPQGTTPVSAGFQGAAFQAPSINPSAGAGLGLGLPQQQCCQPQAGFGTNNFQQGFQGTGFQGVGLQQGFQTGGFGVPQFGAQGARWWTPFVRGTGAYTPLLDLTPNNAGTYLGQGILGQPTAYVNGQLVRNLLRYLAP